MVLLGNAPRLRGYESLVQNFYTIEPMLGAAHGIEPRRESRMRSGSPYPTLLHKWSGMAESNCRHYAPDVVRYRNAYPCKFVEHGRFELPTEACKATAFPITPMPQLFGAPGRNRTNSPALQERTSTIKDTRAYILEENLTSPLHRRFLL